MAYYDRYGGGGANGANDVGGYNGDVQSFRKRDESKTVFDGKRMRKPISRKFIDFYGPLLQSAHARKYERHSPRDRLRNNVYTPAPNAAYTLDMMAPWSYPSNPTSSVTTKFAHASTNKARCPIHVVVWTPEGRRLLTGASTGEFTLWNGMAFNFETIQQAHDKAVRAMVWSNNDIFMISADTGGWIKYWQSNMNNLKAFQGHNECIRDLSFCPTDKKFASCCDDGTVKVWDFDTGLNESTLSGHGSDVRCCDWHPHSSLIASGAKDYLVKLWDAKSAKNVATLHGHKNTIFNIKWNRLNGNWLLSCAKDQLIKLYDIRFMKDMHTFRGHTREVTCLAWHPLHETLFASGAYDGSIMFWCANHETPQAQIPNAHDGSVWDMAWHPLGHVLCSGSNDHTTKFWVRNRPGDPMRDKYNIALLPTEPAPFISNAQAPITKTEVPQPQQVHPSLQSRYDRLGVQQQQQPQTYQQQQPPMVRYDGLQYGQESVPGIGSTTRTTNIPGFAPPPGAQQPTMFPPGMQPSMYSFQPPTNSNIFPQQGGYHQNHPQVQGTNQPPKQNPESSRSSRANPGGYNSRF
jgi:polyadenylation factor subunit 2